MDISHVKKFLAGTSAVAMMLTSVGSVFAAYRDVASGVWYEDAVNAFVDAGYLDASQTRFRGGEAANRAEFVKLVVELNGGILSTAPAVASFNDVSASAWYYGYFEEAAKEGWVKGDKDCYGKKPCYARPSANINRAEAAALIVRAFGLEAVGDAPSFVDNPSGQWYTDVVQTAADHCVLQGDDKTGRARPGDNMNRAEMVVMLHRVDQGLAYGVDCGTEGGEEEEGGGEEAGASISDVRAVAANKVEVEFAVAVDAASAEDVSHYAVAAEGGDEMVVESATATSAEVVTLMMAQSLTAGTDYTLTVTDLAAEGGDLFSDSSSFKGYSAVVKGDGVLEASVSASNPAGDSLPRGSQGVSMLSLDLTASCDDAVVVEDLTVIHQGFGDEADITGLYAAIDGARVTRKRTIDAEDQTADLRFSSPLTIPACGTKTVDVVADFLSTATVSGEHNIAVELPTDLISNAKEVRGNFPMVGNSFKAAAVTSGKITLEYRTISPDEVEVGDTGVVVGKWELSTDAVEDQTIYSLTLEQNSSASDGDFTNIKLRRTDGTVLTNIVQQTVGDYVTLVFDPPFTILEGDKITLEVIADIKGGAADKIIMHFEESSDIFAVGSLYGYGVNGQLYGSQISLPTETTSLPDTITIGAGEFTVEIDGPAQQKYTRDSKDAVLAKVKLLTGGEAVDIKDLFIAIQGQTSSGVGLAGNATYDNIDELLEDVELRNTVTGRTVSAVKLTGTSDKGTGTAATATYQIYRFDDLVVKGDETWEFRVDFIDNGTGNRPLNGDKFRIHICTEESAGTTTCDFGGLVTAATTWNMKIEGLSTGDNVTDVRPGGVVTGNFHRVATPELTVAVKGLSAADTAVKNAKSVNLYRFEARASESKDLLLTKAIFDAESGSLLNAQNYALWVDTILEKGVASQNSKITFQQLAGGGYVVPKEQTVVFEVHGDIAASLTNNDFLLKFATGTADQASYLEVEEADDGSTLSGIKTNGTCQTDTDTTAETNCSVVVTTARSTLWALVNQGNLFVSKDTTPVRNRQLLGGTLGDAILRMQFRAENEDVDVTDLQLTSS
ncbi:S-layer homology domain-containing protein, partial [Candidatus Peregrinibacteria bacterium]|nr:S-layer homology domain-containing protein [Candidatus Peregrinibacteria bacterium]